MKEDNTLTEQLVSLWNHLGLRTAHIAAQMPDEISGLARLHPDRIAGLMICEAIGLDPAPFQSVASRLSLVAGDGGMSAKVADGVEPLLPGCRRISLVGYGAPIWADSVSDHAETIAFALRNLPGEASIPAAKPANGDHAGITYEVHGDGPALVLFPMFLSAAQWDAAMPVLTRHFTVFVLGGRHLGGVALLEDRARSPSYAGMVRTLLEVMTPTTSQTLLEVGCGSGALTRLAATHFGDSHRITAIDLNRYLLREAAELARQDGVADRIEFRHGNAEQLPFADASFDNAYTVTVLEECDADLALRELWRVVKPGGRVGVIVRAIDMPHPWHVDLPDELRQKIDTPSPLVGPRGVADHSLYRRMGAAGFENLTCFPMLASFNRLGGPIWGYFESRVLSRLSAEETELFRSSSGIAREAGVLFVTSPHHCVVGRKPAA